MAALAHTIEKPAHIDERRMRHISDADLFAALDLSRAGLEPVRAAAARADWPAACQAWAAYFALRPTPRPVFNVDGYAALPAELRQARGAPILAQARQVAETPVDFTGASHGRTPLYGVHYLLWLLPLVQGFALDRDPAHGAAFARLFNQWYDTRDHVVGEIQSLDVIWYTLGLAQRSLVFSSAYLTFRQAPALDGPTQARLLKALLGAARWLAEEHDTFRYGNWQVTGICALYEIAVTWPEFTEAAGWRASAWQRIQEHLELDVYPDGGHSERSPSYHQHMLSCLARAASVAELNGQPPLQAHPRFAALYRWLLAQTTPLGCTTNFNDSHLIWPSQWTLQGAVLLEDACLKGLAEQYGTPDQIAWGLASLPDRPAGTAAQVYARLESRPPQLESSLLDTSKFATLRSDAGPEALFMAVNYGPLVGHEYESHSHLDALSFVCAGYGRPLAVEAGLPLTSYDDPLYKSWIRSAAAHNVVRVDDADPDEASKEADLVTWWTSPVADLFEAEHDGYANRGVQHRRAILFVKGEYWIVFDTLALNVPHQLDWRLFSPQPCALEAGSLCPTQAPGLAVLAALPAQGGQLEPVQGLMAVACEPAFEAMNEFREVHGLRHVQQAAPPRACFLHVLYPVRDLAQLPALSVSALPLDVGSGEACAIQNTLGADLFLARGEVEGVVAARGWRTDARLAWLRARDHLAVFGASELNFEQGSIFTSTTPLRALSLRPTAQGLVGDVECTRQTSLSLYVEKTVQQARLNGVPQQLPAGPGREARLLLMWPGRYQFEVIYQL
jgi:hypothetical protein